MTHSETLAGFLLNKDFLPFALGIVALSILLTGFARYLALRFNVMDHPNHRSMHELPVPRGGGMGIVIISTGFYAWLAWHNVLPLRLCFALSVPPLMVALIGLIDDFGHVSRRLRLGTQIGSAALGLLAIGSLPAIELPSGLWQPSNFLMPIALIAMVWLSNLYNFMDGINGLASLEAVFALLAAAALCLINEALPWGFILIVFAAAIAGFLPWNFPRAKIFMGDSGSGFLGLSFGFLIIATGVAGALSIWTWFILLAVFISDASWTLIYRLATGQAWNEPHNSHAYQRISQAINSHVKVSLGATLINVLWLLPLACMAENSSNGIYYATLAYLPLFAVCMKTRAGAPKPAI